MGDSRKISMSNSVYDIGVGEFKNDLAHTYCYSGSCKFLFNGNAFELRAGDLMIVRKCELLSDFCPSADFVCKTIFTSPEFISICIPRSNYGTKGQISLFVNPIMNLNTEQQQVCKYDFEMMEFRLNKKENHFYEEILINTMQTAILDFFDFHSHLHGRNEISSQSANLMNKFIQILESGEYRNSREVAYYAEKLCVTPKYLSEVSKKISGFAANYWITKYAIADISRLLRDKSLSFVQISEMFGFSSPAYFSRYVQQNLGLNPTEYRDGYEE